MSAGVTLRDPATTFFSYDTEVENDAEIGANVVFGPGVSIAKNAVIHPFCHLEGAKIGEGAQIGPFARLRPGTEMGANSKAGNKPKRPKSARAVKSTTSLILATPKWGRAQILAREL